jgi:hypothetical protein
MPNYVINQINFEGDQSKIDTLMQSVKSKKDNGEDYVFDFNKIIPMPESLNITSGGRVDMAMAYVNYQETMDPKGLESYLSYPWVKSAGIDNISQLCDYIKESVDIEEGRKAIYNEKTYGHRDWYSWSTSNWGTKWNASEPVANDNSIEFQTAWSTPEPVLIELSKQHPEVTITIRYADEDIGSNCGRFVLLNGQEIDYETGDTIFSCEVWGYDPADYDDSYRRDQQIDKVLKEGE